MQIGLVDCNTQPVPRDLEIFYDGCDLNQQTTQLKPECEYLTILRKENKDRRESKFENGFSRPDGCTPCKGG